MPEKHWGHKFAARNWEGNMLFQFLFFIVFKMKASQLPPFQLTLCGFEAEEGNSIVSYPGSSWERCSDWGRCETQQLSLAASRCSVVLWVISVQNLGEETWSSVGNPMFARGCQIFFWKAASILSKWWYAFLISCYAVVAVPARWLGMFPKGTMFSLACLGIVCSLFQFIARQRGNNEQEI